MPATSPDTLERPEPLQAFLGELLAEQQRLDTPVARFSDAHDHGPPALARLYRDLIPLSRPGPGEQYAFEVDLDACTGCKACVSACHSLNGLDEGETWREAGLVASPDPRRPFTQTITTACHHCADPACLNGCPVLAYEKDPVTGIVRHLDDQCIGCSYCILTCPYDAPKYNRARGIVRKCDLCHGRLEHGEAPACVQACPTQAIRVVTVRVETGARRRADTSAFPRFAPDPGHTYPTTRYVTGRALPDDLVAADSGRLRPEPSHAPLVVALTFFALAAGTDAAAALGLAPSRWPALLGWGALTAGMAASLFHLGQPLRAWRVFLGLRRSWLSRETVLLGAWWAASAWTLRGSSGSAAPAVSAGLGLATLFCSTMVYVDTRREFWRIGSTAPRLFGGAIVLGLAAAMACAPERALFGPALAGALAVKLAFESRALRSRKDPKASESAQRTARLLTGPLAAVLRLRFALGAAGAAVALLVAAGAAPALAAWIAFGAVLLGEGAERLLFFRAVAAPKMPGLALP